MMGKVESYCKQTGMLEKGDSVLVCLSGGADSVSLLSVLRQLSESWGLTLYACHLNHCLRGEEARRDEDFVRALCKGWGVPLTVWREDVGKLAKESGRSVEEAAREVRYALFAKEAARLGAKIATAHTLSDDVETVLFHMARGTGLAGLCGIPPVRGNIIRPLLCCTRREVEAYLAEKGLSYVEDSTNADISYSRNRLRHQVVPAFLALNPGFEQNFRQMTAILKEEEDYLRGQTPVEDRVAALIALHPAIRRRALCALLERAGFAPSFSVVEKVEAVLLGKAKQYNLAGQAFVWVEEGVLRVGKKTEVPYFEAPLSVGRIPLFGERVAIVSIIDGESLCNFKIVNKNLSKAILDFDKICGNAIIRQRKTGDFIHLAKRDVGKSLKKLFIEAKVPQSKRGALPVIADSEGVIWAESFGADRRVEVGADTRRILCIEITGGM